MKTFYRTKIAKLIKDKFDMSFSDSLLMADFCLSKDRSPDSKNQAFAVYDIEYFECNCCAKDFSIWYNDKVISVGDIIDYINSAAKIKRTN